MYLRPSTLHKSVFLAGQQHLKQHVGQYIGSSSFWNHRFYSSNGSTKKEPPRITGRSGLNRILWVLPTLTFCLGTWQVYRLKWKTKVLEDAESSFSQKPVNLPLTSELILNDTTSSSNSLVVHNYGDFRKVKVNGQFDPNRFILIGPRARAQDSEPGATGAPHLGYYVVVPFKRSDDNNEILVNLGFIPQEYKWKGNSHIPKNITIEGILREGEKVSSLAIKNNPERGQWLWLDAEDLATNLGTQPVLVELLNLPDTNFHLIQDENHLPAGRETFKGIPNRHLEYVITWYGLTAVGVLLMTFC